MDAVLNSEAILDCGNRPVCVLDKTLNLSVHSHRRNENNDSYLRTFLLVQWLRLGVSSAGYLVWGGPDLRAGLLLSAAIRLDARPAD